MLSHVSAYYELNISKFLRPDVVTNICIFFFHFIIELHVLVCSSGLSDMQFLQWASRLNKISFCIVSKTNQISLMV